MATMLSIPFKSDEIVPLIKPNTLEMYQSVGNTLSTASSTDVAVRIYEYSGHPGCSAVESSPDMTNNINLAMTKVKQSTKFYSDTKSTVSALRTDRYTSGATQIHQKNTTILYWTRSTFPCSRQLVMLKSRPSAMEKLVHDAVVHPSLHGKISQFAMESAQQGHRTKFLATPPVLQLAYDLSFAIRGLSAMRVRRFIQELEPQSSTTGINMTIFGRSNALRPASPPFSLRYIVDAFETLLLFAQGFYYNTVCDFIKADAEFMARMSVLSQPDVAMCNMLVHWLDPKLGKFHSEIIESNLQKRLVLDLSSPERMAI
ncbi:hypothetical protein PHMEG_00030580 [Phytophthora megakarya]|uniref:Uncharacterized protein n=1 Tax=Phytophthora megakarya TaxID=4795 RepID=A0A225V010_9STRA|nr:hypothetical protein PHMEG_00030580 [Phytophthora megakarya]